MSLLERSFKYYEGFASVDLHISVISLGSVLGVPVSKRCNIKKLNRFRAGKPAQRDVGDERGGHA